MAVCFGVWLSLGEGGSTRVAQHPTTPSAAETTPTRQLPPPPPPPPPRRPPTCADGAELCAPGCCSSGRDCGEEGCGAYLSPNEYWDLRLWEIRRRGEDSKSRRITNGDIDVCVTRLRDNERVCVNRREVVSGFGKALPVSKADLTRHGLSIEVEESDGDLAAYVQADPESD